MTTIFIVHESLGFLFLLGRSLNAAGYRVFPALNVAEARSLVYSQDIRIDLLIISATQLGAIEFVQKLRNRQAQLSIIIVAEENGADIPVVLTQTGGSVGRSSASLAEWLRLVRTALGPENREDEG